MRDHLLQSTTRQVWMAANQMIVTRHFGLILKRGAVTPIEIGDLRAGEIFEREPCADVERRLVHICDKQVRLRRIGDRHRQPLPWPRRIERTLVVPRAEKPKDFTPEAAGEEPVYFIQPPDQRR